jgi:antitoxin HicB
MKRHSRVYEVLITQESDGTFSCSVPSLPGCYSQEDTLVETKKNAIEAIRAFLESIKKDRLPLYDPSEAFISHVEVEA